MRLLCDNAPAGCLITSFLLTGAAAAAAAAVALQIIKIPSTAYFTDYSGECTGCLQKDAIV
jgi:hypothetical protein